MALAPPIDMPMSTRGGSTSSRTMAAMSPHHGVAAVIFVWCPLRITMAALIKGPHMIVPADAWTEFVPGMGALVEPVQQKHGGTASSAPVHIVERQAIGGQLLIRWFYCLRHIDLLTKAREPHTT